MKLEVFILVMLIVATAYVFFEIRREKKRTRVLSAFIAGLIVQQLHRGVPYEDILNFVAHEFDADYWVDPAQRFFKRERNLFFSEPMGNGGFNMIFWDFFDMETNSGRIARLDDPQQRVAGYAKLSEFLRQRAAQMGGFLSQDLERQRLFEQTGTDELYNDLRFYNENKQQ